jgi:Uma2 family endonuclease
LKELRFTFANRSIVPDIVVISCEKIPLNDEQELDNDSILFAPDWCIEILSPNQKPTKVIDNILFCLENVTQLGWLIDSEEKLIMVFEPEKPLKIYHDEDILPVINKLSLQLRVNQIFSWPKIK